MTSQFHRGPYHEYYKDNDYEAPVVDYNGHMPFGKYRGQSVRDLIHYNPRYMRWLMDNLSHVHFGRDVYTQLDIREAALRKQPRTQKARKRRPPV